MTVQRFQARVGAARISPQMRAGGSVLSQIEGTDSSQAQFTEQVRSSMAGIISEFNRWCDWMNDQGAEVLYDALEPTYEKTQERVPVDTGDLKDSGYLEKRTSRGSVQVEIGYGRGGEPPYAVFVHEKTDIKHASPTSAKFLQGPLEEDSDAIQERILQGLKEASGV